MKKVFKITLLLTLSSSVLFASQPYKTKKATKLRQSPHIVVSDAKLPSSDFKEASVNSILKKADIKPTTSSTVKKRIIESESNISLTSSSYVPSAKELRKVDKLQRKLEKNASGGVESKSQLVALLLALVVGALGIHRFYLGYKWQGIVQLLTLGGFGIWSLIDLVRIILGTLKPKGGEYDETL